MYVSNPDGQVLASHLQAAHGMPRTCSFGGSRPSETTTVRTPLRQRLLASTSLNLEASLGMAARRSVLDTRGSWEKIVQQQHSNRIRADRKPRWPGMAPLKHWLPEGNLLMSSERSLTTVGQDQA